MLQEKQYVSEYKSLVDRLLTESPRDEAMNRAVGGGDYNQVGETLTKIIEDFGFSAGKRIVDIGCGSGRLSVALSRKYGSRISYIGKDIVLELIEYAKEKSHSSYKFILDTELTVPASDKSTDFIVFFSVFTHLFHEQSFIYLRDSKRALAEGGRVIFSFLEAKKQWPIFESIVNLYGRDDVPMTMYLEMPMIEAWCDHLGLKIENYVAFDAPGQSIISVSAI